MRRESIKRGNIFRKNRMPTDLAGLRNQIYRCNRQGRRMQRLANVAGCFRTTIVLMSEGATSSKIKQYQAA